MNPFILSSYHSPEYFCDREAETERLFDAVRNNRNITLISRRRMGKTGLLKHLENKLKTQKDICFVYFDIMPTASVSEFVGLFANSLFNADSNKIDSLFRAFSKLFSAFKPSFSVNSLTGETKFNLELASPVENESSLAAIFKYITSSNKKFVIAIDEFQQVASYQSVDFEGVLRSCIQHLNNCAFFFAGSSRDTLKNMFTNSKKPFYMSSELMFLSNIDKQNYTEFIINNFAKGNIAINEESIDYLLELTDVHTFYVQLLCNRLFSLGTKKIGKEDVKTVFLRILDENRYYFESYRNIITDYQWKLLKAIARDKKVPEITSKSFILRHQLGTPSSVGTATKSLEKKDIIYRENGYYMIHDLLFSAWLAR